MKASAKLIAVTMGEPAGIAGEITLKAWLKLQKNDNAAFFVIGDSKYYRDTARQLKLDVPVKTVTTTNEARKVFHQALPVIEYKLDYPVTIAKPDSQNAKSVIASIEQAAKMAIDHSVDAIVTNPIQKETLYQAGFHHQGHTDFLGNIVNENGGKAEPVMMLSTGDLRTVPITVHISLAEVLKDLDTGLIVSQTRQAIAGLQRWYGLARPRVAITGLNPHAGEKGAMGSEEETIIEPAIAELKAEGHDVRGPFPADTVFNEISRKHFDIIMCMYHDQALIPVKTIGFHDGVNTTLGLGFIRTSPDHGTALDLAGKGVADPSSLVSAINLACKMSISESGRS